MSLSVNTRYSVDMHRKKSMQLVVWIDKSVLVTTDMTTRHPKLTARTSSYACFVPEADFSALKKKTVYSLRQEVITVSIFESKGCMESTVGHYRLHPHKEVTKRYVSETLVYSTVYFYGLNISTWITLTCMSVNQKWSNLKCNKWLVTFLSLLSPALNKRLRHYDGRSLVPNLVYFILISHCTVFCYL